MVGGDFPAWYSASVFGGIGCAMLSAATIAAWALWRHRGAGVQAIGALLICALASALDIGPLLWIEYRLSVYGPTLPAGEVALALVAAALVGWATPLAALCAFLLLARPVPTARDAVAVASGPTARGGVSPAALDDPERERAAFEDGLPWGALVPMGAPADSLTGAPARAISLTYRLTLIGRESDNDIVLDDERISRRHAELRWERGRVELADYGSLNGTLVNEQAVRGRLPLRVGDVIQLGKRRYQLDLREVVRPAPADAGELEGPETRKTRRAPDSLALAQPRLRLVAFQGADAGGAWPLSAAVTTIGRGAVCAIVISDPSISRIHAQVMRQPAGYFLSDVGSSNGVWLNGERLAGPAQIGTGDVIALGDTMMRCEADAPAETPPETPTSSLAETQARTPAAPPSPPGVEEEPAPLASPLTPISRPEFHMRIAPEWRTDARSRPRLAPPRLRPAEPPKEQPSDPPLA
ncbi:MAG TPA: FHA domain-containing protein [Ktedonobacterales bacterium]